MTTPTPPETQPSLPKRQKVVDFVQTARYSIHRTVPTPLTVPVERHTDDNLPPGKWATYAKTLPWGAARRGTHIKTAALRAMVAAPSVREPLLRTKTEYSAQRLDDRIGYDTANAESVLIQITGVVSQQQCSHCLKAAGPWSQCVRFHDTQRSVTACGNCYWNGQKKRCDFYEPPAGDKAPGGHQMDRSSTSSVRSHVASPGEDEDRFPVSIPAIEELKRAVLQMQSEGTIEEAKTTAIRMLLQSDNVGDSITAMRTLIPDSTPEQRRAQFDRILGMIDGMKEAHARGGDV